MSKQTKNSCARAFGNQSRNKNLRLKESSGGGVRLIPPPPPFMPSRVKIVYFVHTSIYQFQVVLTGIISQFILKSQDVFCFF